MEVSRKLGIKTLNLFSHINTTLIITHIKVEEKNIESEVINKMKKGRGLT